MFFRIASCILFLAAPDLVAQTYVAPCIRDTGIGGFPSDANGSGQVLNVGNGQTWPVQYALFKFDLSNVPSNACVTSVRMEVYSLANWSGRGVIYSQLCPITQDWGEASSITPPTQLENGPAQSGDATLGFAFYPSVPWTNGTPCSAPVARHAFARQTGWQAFSSAAMVSDVQRW